MPPKKRATSSKKPPAPPAAKAPERGRATKGAARQPAKRRPRATPEQGKETTGRPGTGTKGTVPGPPTGKGRPAGGESAKAKAGPGLIERAAKPKPGATYHRWILAEFIGALLLAVLGGILSPRKRADGQPTWVHLIVQVSAIAGVFFILALLSAGQKVGKIAAAFGFLVLLGVMINSADAIRKTAAIFAPTKKTTSQPAGAAPTGAPVPGQTSSAAEQ